MKYELDASALCEGDTFEGAVALDGKEVPEDIMPVGSTMEEFVADAEGKGWKVVVKDTDPTGTVHFVMLEITVD